MATNPIPMPPVDDLDEPQLSRDEGYELLFSLFGTAGEMYAKVGGAEAFMRAERAAWGEESSDVLQGNR